MVSVGLSCWNDISHGCQVSGPAVRTVLYNFRMNQGGGLACCAVCSQKTYRRCARCLIVYYCNTEHQRQDWKRHKSECAPKISKHTNTSGDSTVIKEAAQKEKQEKFGIITNSNHDVTRESINATSRQKKSKPKKNYKEGSVDAISKHTAVLKEKDQPSVNSSECNESSVTNTGSNTDGAITYEGSSENEILNETAQQLNTVDFYAAGVGAAPAQAVNKGAVKMPVLPERPARPREYPEASLQGSAAPFSHSANSYHMDPTDPCYQVCQRVISDMTEYGVCVLDNFLGKERGHSVLSEVLDMYKTGIFRVSLQNYALNLYLLNRLNLFLLSSFSLKVSSGAIHFVVT